MDDHKTRLAEILQVFLGRPRTITIPLITPLHRFSMLNSHFSSSSAVIIQKFLGQIITVASLDGALACQMSCRLPLSFLPLSHISQSALESLAGSLRHLVVQNAGYAWLFAL